MTERSCPMPGEYYRHFKGNLYEIITVAQHTETREKLVVYRALYGDYRDYARPLEMFLSEVDHEKYPECGQKYRFEKTGDRVSGLIPPAEAEAMKVSHETDIRGESREACERRSESGSEGKLKEILNDPEPGFPADRGTGGESLKKRNEKTPLIVSFLELDDPQKQLELLARRREEVDSLFLDNVSVSLDLLLPEGSPEERLYHLERYLRTVKRFDGSRLR